MTQSTQNRALFGLSIAVWGLAPWVDDHGLLILLGAFFWALLCTRSLSLSMALPFGASALHLLELPSVWSNGQGGSWLAALSVYAGVVVLQGLPGALAAWCIHKAHASIGLPLASFCVWGFTAGLSPWVQALPAQHALFLADSTWWLLPAALGGRSFLTSVVAGWGGLLVSRPRLALPLLLLWWMSGWLLLLSPREDHPTTLALIQPDVHVMDARVPSHAPRLQTHLLQLIDRAAAHSPTLIATPEGIWTEDPGDHPGTRRDKLLHSVNPDWPLLLGTTIGRHPPRSNSLLALHGGKVRARFDKHLLVPIWERAFLIWGRDQYRPGDRPPKLKLNGLDFGVLICYEDLFEEQVRAASGSPLLVLSTNDSWLGSTGRNAHLAAARLAAVSTGSTVIRPTLDGLSAIINPNGELVQLHRPTTYWPNTKGQLLLWRGPLGSGQHPGVQISRWWSLLSMVLGLVLAGRRFSQSEVQRSEPR